MSLQEAAAAVYLRTFSVLLSRFHFFFFCVEMESGDVDVVACVHTAVSYHSSNFELLSCFTNKLRLAASKLGTSQLALLPRRRAIYDGKRLAALRTIAC